MYRMIPRLSAALLTFALGIAVSAIYSMYGVRCISNGYIAKIEVRMPQVELSCYPGISIETPAIAGSSYFPSRKLSQNERSDETVKKWYSRHLRAMKEVAMYSPGSHEVESYRFLWLRTFHHPVAVRIWKCGSAWCVSVKELNGAGGYESGSLIVDRSRKLTASEWSEFKRRLDASCYWNLPSPEDAIGNDGAQWIFEAVKGGRYHIVDRWTPQTGSYRELCLYALTLSGLEIESRDLY